MILFFTNRLFFTFLLLFTFIVINPNKAKVNNPSNLDKTKNKQNQYYELELSAGFNLLNNLKNSKPGLGFGLNIIQNYFLSAQNSFVSLMSGGEIRYNCLRNANGNNCLSMIGPVIFLRGIFKNFSSSWAWLEPNINIQGGLAYAKISLDLESISNSGSGLIGYTTLSSGLLFTKASVGLRLSYLVDFLFFSDKLILSHVFRYGLIYRF